MRKALIVGMALSLGLYWIGADVDAQSGGPKRRRAARPKFSAQERSIYFDNIFKEGLAGKRPADFGKPRTAQPTGGPNSAGDTGATGSGFAWSKLIDAMSIENEIKAVKKQIDLSITTPNKFASGGFQEARLNFTILATLFAVISEYDTEIRFKKAAPEARQLFARLAANSTAGSNAVFQQAKQRKADLQDVINGGSVVLPGPLQPLEDWSMVCDRGPIMERLDLALNERIKPVAGSEKSFTESAEVILHEANIVALFAEVLTKEGMQDGDEDDYISEAKKLQNGALDVIAGVKQSDFAKATAGIGQMGQACTICHETWN